MWILARSTQCLKIPQKSSHLKKKRSRTSQVVLENDKLLKDETILDGFQTVWTSYLITWDMKKIFRITKTSGKKILICSTSIKKNAKWVIQLKKAIMYTIFFIKKISTTTSSTVEMHVRADAAAWHLRSSGLLPLGLHQRPHLIGQKL